MKVKEVALNEFKETEKGKQRYRVYDILLHITITLGLIDIIFLPLNICKLSSVTSIILISAFLYMLFIIWDYYEVKILKVALEDYERRH